MDNALEGDGGTQPGRCQALQKCFFLQAWEPDPGKAGCDGGAQAAGQAALGLGQASVEAHIR